MPAEMNADSRCCFLCLPLLPYTPLRHSTISQIRVTCQLYVITAMPKQNGKHQTVGSTSQWPGKEGVSSPYFAKPVTSPYFDKIGKPDKSSQSRVETSDVSVKRRSKIKSAVSKQVGDQVESVSIQPGAGASEGTKPKRKRSKASSTPSVTGLRLVLRNTHSDRSVPMAYRILAVKPRLIQGQWI
jgi:hypothetical protein